MPNRTHGKRSNGGCYQKELGAAMSRFLPHNGLATLPGNLLQRWTARLLVHCAILMAWDPGSTLADRFDSARYCLVEMFNTRRRPGKTYAGFINALVKVSDTLLATVVTHLRKAVVQVAGDHWTINGWTVFGADGSRPNCSMTQANEQAFGLASRKKSWPQMLLTLVFHVGTGLPWAFKRGGARESERSHLLQMLGLLPKKSLLIADAGFTGYDLLKTLKDAGHSFIIRVGANVEVLRGLGYAVREHDGVVYLWPRCKQKKNLEPLILRLITLTDGRNRRINLLTDILDVSLLSDKDALAIYLRRWPVEVLYRSLKQTMNRRKMLSDSPAHARVELDWSVIGLWMLGLMGAEAAATTARLSIAGVLRAVRRAMSGRGGSLPKALTKARLDNYQRAGSKKARHWPHKKRDKPPGNPKARTATEPEVLLAQELLGKKKAA